MSDPAPTDPREEILETLEGALEDVLATLGGNGGADRPHALDAARLRANEVFLQLCAADLALGPEARPYPEPLRARVQAILRLDALAQSLAGEARERLAAERGRVTTARALLRQHVGPDASRSGRSCDVRG